MFHHSISLIREHQFDAHSSTLAQQEIISLIAHAADSFEKKP